MIKFQYPNKPKPWLTTGIKVSCANKRKLYLIYRNSNDSDFKKNIILNTVKSYLRLFY